MFYWVLPSFIGFNWILLHTNECLSRFHLVLLGFTGFYWLLWGLIWVLRASTGCHWAETGSEIATNGEWRRGWRATASCTEFFLFIFFFKYFIAAAISCQSIANAGTGPPTVPFLCAAIFFAIFLAIHPLEKNERKTNQINGLFTTRPFPCSLWYDRFFFYLVLPSFTVLHWLLFGCPSLPWFDWFDFVWAGFSGFYRGLPSFTGFFIWIYLVWLVFTRFDRVWPGFT